MRAQWQSNRYLQAWSIVKVESAHLQRGPPTFKALAASSSDGLPQAQFSPALKSWTVVDEAQMLSILRNPLCISPGAVEHLKSIEGRFGADLANLLWIATVNPLLNEGETHLRARRELANWIAERRGDIASKLPELVSSEFGKLLIAGEVEVMSECVLPFVGRLQSELLGLRRPLKMSPLVGTYVFDRFSGLSNLLRCNAQIGEFRAEIESQNLPIATSTALNLWVLGGDSLASSLGASLHHLFLDACQAGSNSYDFSRPYPSTGVAAAERICVGSLELGESKVLQGERLRLYMQGMNANIGSGVHVFGAGPHSCLGKVIALDVWNALAKCLKAMSRVPKHVEAEFHNSSIFHMPKNLKVVFQ